MPRPAKLSPRSAHCSPPLPSHFQSRHGLTTRSCQPGPHCQSLSDALRPGCLAACSRGFFGAVCAADVAACQALEAAAAAGRVPQPLGGDSGRAALGAVFQSNFVAGLGVALRVCPQLADPACLELLRRAATCAAGPKVGPPLIRCCLCGLPAVCSDQVDAAVKAMQPTELLGCPPLVTAPMLCSQCHPGHSRMAARSTCAWSRCCPAWRATAARRRCRGWRPAWRWAACWRTCCRMLPRWSGPGGPTWWAGHRGLGRERLMALA